MLCDDQQVLLKLLKERYMFTCVYSGLRYRIGLEFFNRDILPEVFMLVDFAAYIRTS